MQHATKSEVFRRRKEGEEFETHFEEEFNLNTNIVREKSNSF